MPPCGQSQEPHASGRQRSPGAGAPPPQLQSRSPRTREVLPDAVLPRMSLELDRGCNLRCTYCYTEASTTPEPGLTEEELRRIVRQAVELGAGLVSIVGGGEPLMRASLVRDGESIIDFANTCGCYCYLYTNCTLLTADTAHWLSTREVSVIGKLNSLREDLQDSLVQVKGAAKRIRNGIDALLKAGFTALPANLLPPDLPNGEAVRPPKAGEAAADWGAESRLALETIICRENYEEIPDLWRWMRDRRIIPEVEIPTLHGRARQHSERLMFSEQEAPAKYGALFEELARIDREDYGFQWVPHPPFPGASCRLFETNCYVNSRGGVQPCAGVDREFGFLKARPAGADAESLAEVVKRPEFLQIRAVRSLVKDPCRSCDLLKECYGCRGAAFQATGDPFAGDPVCWRPRQHPLGAGRPDPLSSACSLTGDG